MGWRRPTKDLPESVLKARKSSREYYYRNRELMKQKHQVFYLKNKERISKARTERRHRLSPCKGCLVHCPAHELKFKFIKDDV